MSACSPESTAGPSDGAEPIEVAAALQAALDDAGVDAAQIESLENALAATRYPSDDEYRIAWAAAGDCMSESGIANVALDEFWNAGILEIGFSYSGSIDSEQSDAKLIEECQRVHVAYIQQARASKAVYEAAQEAIQAEYLPALKACLAERGFPVSDDADYVATTNADLAANEAEGTATGCMESTGFVEAMTGPPEGQG